MLYKQHPHRGGRGSGVGWGNGRGREGGREREWTALGRRRRKRREAEVCKQEGKRDANKREDTRITFAGLCNRIARFEAAEIKHSWPFKQLDKQLDSNAVPCERR